MPEASVIPLTWKIKLTLSLSVASSGESIGICLVNLVSNWDTSSSLFCSIMHHFAGATLGVHGRRNTAAISTNDKDADMEKGKFAKEAQGEVKSLKMLYTASSILPGFGKCHL